MSLLLKLPLYASEPVRERLCAAVFEYLPLYRYNRIVKRRQQYSAKKSACQTSRGTILPTNVMLE